MDNVFLNEALKRLLNLPTHPVSVKYIGTFDEDVEWDLADLGFYRPRNPVNLCQGVGLSRHHGRKVLLAARARHSPGGALGGGSKGVRGDEASAAEPYALRRRGSGAQLPAGLLSHRGVEGSNGPKKLGPEQFWKWLLT